MDETGTDALSGEPFHVAARLAESEAAQGRFADPEETAHQVIESHVASCDVAPALRGVDFQRVVPGQRLERLRFDQRDLAVGPVLARVGAGPKEVPISLDAAARDRSNRFGSLHPGARGGSDVERHHSSCPHRGAV